MGTTGGCWWNIASRPNRHSQARERGNPSRPRQPAGGRDPPQWYVDVETLRSVLQRAEGATERLADPPGGHDEPLACHLQAGSTAGTTWRLSTLVPKWARPLCPKEEEEQEEGRARERERERELKPRVLKPRASVLSVLEREEATNRGALPEGRDSVTLGGAIVLYGVSEILHVFTVRVPPRDIVRFVPHRCRRPIR